MKHGVLLLAMVVLCSCVGMPEGVVAVEGFEPDRYLGTWYEIARLDHWFERGLTHGSAEYTAREDGGIDVLNRGYDPETGEWSEAEGRAYFVSDRTTGRLEVSFFRPFYGGYNVIALDKEHYSWALVCGNDRSYLWILAREKTMDEAEKCRLLAFARELEFPVDELLFPKQD